MHDEIFPTRQSEHGHRARLILDGVSPSGCRLTTFELKFPRMVLAEFNTHRMLSRNAASSRAIPVQRLMNQVVTSPVIPCHWGWNQKGMQAQKKMSATEALRARGSWLRARDRALVSAQELLDLGLHKQYANRVLEPWMWATVLATGTEWSNFWHQRDHKDAHPEIREIAGLAHELFRDNIPREYAEGEWYLPLVDTTTHESPLWIDPNVGLLELRKVSVGRCARVSYLSHDGVRDPNKDVELHDQLQGTFADGDPGHFSPFEHQAKCLSSDVRVGNFFGWFQYRKEFPNEHFGRQLD